MCAHLQPTCGSLIVNPSLLGIPFLLMVQSSNPGHIQRKTTVYEPATLAASVPRGAPIELWCVVHAGQVRHVLITVVMDSWERPRPLCTAAKPICYT
jgi:hypothetical protein